MHCPTCDHTMQATGCQVTERPFFWCPRCGTFKSCDGDVAAPDIVRRTRKMASLLIDAEEPDGIQAMRIIGLLEAAYLPDDRPITR